MKLTPEEIARFEAAEAAGQTTARPEATQEEIDRFNASGPSALDYVQDVGLAAPEAGVNIMDTTLQGMANLPFINTITRSIEGAADVARGKPVGDAVLGAAFPTQPNALAKTVQAGTGRARDVLEGARAIPEGQSPALDATRTGVRVALEAAAGGGPRVLPMSVAAGLGGGGASYLSDGSPVMEGLGSIGGALLGGNPRGLAQGAADVGRAVGRKARDFGGLFRKGWNTITGKGDDFAYLDTASWDRLKKATEDVIINAYDPSKTDLTPQEFQEDLIKRLEEALARGERGTVGQLTGDPGILSFEQGLKANAADSDGLRELARQFDAVNAELAGIPMGELDTIAPTGDATALPRTARGVADERAGATLARGEEAAGAAEAAGEQGMTQVGGIRNAAGEGITRKALQEAAPPGVEITETGRAGFRQLDDSVQKAYNDAWGKAVDAEPYEIGGRFQSYTQYIEGLPQQLDRALKQVDLDIEKMSLAGGADVRKLDERIGKEVRRLVTSSDPAAKALAQELKQARDYMRQGLPPGVRDKLASVDAIYPSYLVAQEAFRSAPLNAENIGGKELQRGVKKFGGGNRQIARGEGPMQDVGAEGVEQDYFLTEAQKTAKRELTAAKARAKKLRSEAKTGRKRTLKEAETARKRALKEAERDAQYTRTKDVTGRVGQFEPRPEEVNEAVRELYKQGRTTSRGERMSPKAAIRKLVDDVGQTPEGREDLRRAFAAEMVNTTGKDGRLTKTGYETFKRRRKELEDAGVFTPEELDRLGERFAQGQKAFLHEEVRNIPDMPTRVRRISEALASFGGAKVGAAAMPGISLVGAALGSRTGKELLESLTDKQSRDLAYQLTLKPERFVNEYNKLAEALKTKRGVREAWRNFVAKAATVSAAEQED